MSREFFEGGIAPLKVEKTEYQQGSNPHQDLADTLVIAYLTNPTEIWTDNDLASRILAEQDFECQSLIDTVLLKLACTDKDNQISSDCLIRSLVVFMYLSGYNGLQLDYSHFSFLGGIGRDLFGIPDDPLMVSYKLPQKPSVPPCPSIGQMSSHSQIDINGQALVVGNNARASSFYIDTPPMVLGNNSYGCEFYLEYVQEYSLRLDGNFILEQTLEEGRMYLYPESEFFNHGNNILIPDDRGGWQEVEPE